MRSKEKPKTRFYIECIWINDNGFAWNVTVYKKAMFRWHIQYVRTYGDLDYAIRQCSESNNKLFEIIVDSTNL